MPSDSRCHFVHLRHVEFAETDMAGMVHFSNWFRFVESAEHAFLRSLGLAVHVCIDGEQYGWPRLRAVCDYRLPLRLEDVVRVELSVTRLDRRSMAYQFVLRPRDDADAEIAGTASLEVGCARRDRKSGIYSSAAMPAAIYTPLAALVDAAPG